MPLNVGSRLAHDSITVRIGEGGMGEVYRVDNASNDTCRNGRRR
jgi:hypothetical protein